MNVSYPDLAPLPDALADDLTKRMRAFLRAGGECKVGLITPEVISIQCRSDHTRAVFTFWREAKLPAIDAAELVGADRLKSLCGDAPRPMFILDRDGLRWIADDDHVAPDDCIGGIEWADMAPASTRARALVARGTIPPE
jgi:hypothetical protein